MAKKATPKRKTRRRPVLQFRVAETEYEDLAKAAAKNQLTISEEAAKRLRAWRVVAPLRGTDMEVEAYIADKMIYVHDIRRTQESKPNDHETPDVRPALRIEAHDLEALLIKAAKLGAELALKELQKTD